VGFSVDFYSKTAYFSQFRTTTALRYSTGDAMVSSSNSTTPPPSSSGQKAVEKTPLSQQLNEESTSALDRYQQKVLGSKSVGALVQYELLILLLGNVAGSLGYLLRKKFYPKLFKEVGRSVIFGKGLVLRHPGRIVLGDRVAIDDYSLLDAGGDTEGIVIGEGSIISRNCVIQSKTAPITIGNSADIGCNVILTANDRISIGNNVLIAGNCYIGGGRYRTDRLDIPIMNQGLYTNGPVIIGDDVWLGAGATVLDGVRIGQGCIVGAGAMVTKDLPEYAIATGVPAKVVKYRTDNKIDHY